MHMHASGTVRYPRRGRQAGVLRIEIAAVVMLFMALAIVLITHAPPRNAHPSTAVAAPPLTGPALIVAGHGSAKRPLQRIAVPPADTAGAPKP